ncbi:transcription initiation factor TFIID subunit 4 isoform X2 [Plutella xylostella]|uniref:transcription initiation factor TFIID subunit 4 isoform X2 n=1 Tax=Plutella xylostella TaxID=51655 RepID=UPI002032853C|nr:transcription initiation factor TFIID subunit 4 isoform X2 [Plutella xylostella]
MSNNLENDRSISATKMYPIDLAPQKITIVKSVPTSEVKMSHLVSGQGGGGAGLGLARAPQLLAGGSTQPHMIVSSSAVLQGSQIVSHSGSSQMMPKTQLIGSSGQIISPATQIISQGTQLNSQMGGNPVNNSGSGQVLSVGGLAGAPGGLVVSSSVRALPPSVRVLPQISHHNTRPVLSHVSSVGGVVVTGHVPRAAAAAASLAAPRAAPRPAHPASITMPISPLGAVWSQAARGVRGAVVYSSRAPRAAAPRAPPPPPRAPAPPPRAAPPAPAPRAAASLASTSVLTTRAAPGPRHYQPAPKVLGVGGAPRAGGGAGGGALGAPPQLYYEAPRRAAPPAPPADPAPAPLALNNNTVAVSAAAAAARRGSADARAPPRPSILRKRDVDGSGQGGARYSAEAWSPPASPGGGGGGGAGGGGSTTESAASSPARDDPASPPASPLVSPAPSPPPGADASPRKKPRKQMLSAEARRDPAPAPAPAPPAPVVKPHKRPSLRAGYVCAWRACALHFVRPADVRRRAPPAAAAAPRALPPRALRRLRASADGWKVHHVTAQMDDLISLEADAGCGLAGVLRALEAPRAPPLAPHKHALIELVKGNMQRSRIVCEGVAEARADVLRVFTHRAAVAELLARRADRRALRPPRSHS